MSLRRPSSDLTSVPSAPSPPSHYVLHARPPTPPLTPTPPSSRRLAGACTLTPVSTTGHSAPPSPLPQPIPFRARPCPAPGTEISRPVPLRTPRGTSPAPHTRTWSFGDLRSGPASPAGSGAGGCAPPPRMVSFTSIVTPQSAASLSADDEPPSRSWGASGRRATPGSDSESDRDRDRDRTRRPCVRLPTGLSATSSTSSADVITPTLPITPTQGFAPRGTPLRSRSALAPDVPDRRADGPRPWDMRTASDAPGGRNARHFASFGARRARADRLASFADTFSSRQLLRHGGRTNRTTSATGCGSGMGGHCDRGEWGIGAGSTERVGSTDSWATRELGDRDRDGGGGLRRKLRLFGRRISATRVRRCGMPN